MDIYINCARCSEISKVSKMIIDDNGTAELHTECGHIIYIALDLLAPVHTGNPALTKSLSFDERMDLSRIKRVKREPNK